MGWLGSPNAVAIVALVILAIGALLYNFAPLPLFDLDKPTRMWFEAVTLAITVIMGAVAGAAFTVSLASKRPIINRARVIDGSMVVIILVAAWAYTTLPHVGTGEFNVIDAIYKASALTILIWVGAMLAAKFGIRWRISLPENAAKAATGGRRTTRNTAALLESWLYNGASITVVVAMAVAVVATLNPAEQSTHLVKLDTLFTASATIMGFAAFGSALTTLSTNRSLIKSIAYALLPVITVQAVFMVSLVSDINFPATVWIGMTAIWLFLLVLAMVANKILPDKTGGATNSVH